MVVIKRSLQKTTGCPSTSFQEMHDSNNFKSRLPFQEMQKINELETLPKKSKVFVMDTGGDCVKCGFNDDHPETLETKVSSIPNVIFKSKFEKTRVFVGDAVSECRNLSSLYYIRPFQKGYLVNVDEQKIVWDRVLDIHGIKNPSSLSLILTEPELNFESVQNTTDQILFRQYKFDRVLRINASDLVCYQNKVDHPSEQGCVVVDVGFSFTTIIPFLGGRKLKSRIRRINIGGKHLTNHLKELISYRQLHVMDETYVINQVKEDCCYVAAEPDFAAQMAVYHGRTSHCDASSSSTKRCTALRRKYVLPDFSTRKRGYIVPCVTCLENEKKQQNEQLQYSQVERQKSTDKSSAEKIHLEPSDEQFIAMGNERISVPELIFHPCNVGIEEMSLAEAIVDACANTQSNALSMLRCQNDSSTQQQTSTNENATDEMSQSCPSTNISDEKLLFLNVDTPPLSDHEQSYLYQNIVVVGGSSHFENFRQRLQMEVRKFAPDKFKVVVRQPEKPAAYAFQGGCSLAKAHRLFTQMSVSKDEYMKFGKSVTSQKFNTFYD